MLNYMLEHWDELINLITMIVALAAAIAALTPTPKDDSVLAVIRKIVDALALNVRHAQNSKAIDVKTSEAQKVKNKVLGRRR